MARRLSAQASLLAITRRARLAPVTNGPLRGGRLSLDHRPCRSARCPAGAPQVPHSGAAFCALHDRAERQFRRGERRVIASSARKSCCAQRGTLRAGAEASGSAHSGLLEDARDRRLIAPPQRLWARGSERVDSTIPRPFSGALQAVQGRGNRTIARPRRRQPFARTMLADLDIP